LSVHDAVEVKHQAHKAGADASVVKSADRDRQTFAVIVKRPTFGPNPVQSDSVSGKAGALFRGAKLCGPVSCDSSSHRALCLLCLSRGYRCGVAYQPKQ
jgi:hypothetical protein